MGWLMSDLDISRLYEVPVAFQTANSTIQCSASQHVPMTTINSILQQVVSTISMWRVIVFLLVLGNVKNLPMVWHLRILNAFRFTLRSQRPKEPVAATHLFQPMITTTHAPLMEMDFNLHKNNSSYFSDIDIARTHLVCTLFSTGIEYMRGGTGAITAECRPGLGLPVGGVSCIFKKELKPYEPYELWTRVLSWDKKWLYIVTHFVKAGVMTPRKYTLYPQQNGKGDKKSKTAARLDDIEESDAVVATALSRCVFKQGRRTISPEVMLQLSGLLPKEAPEIKSTSTSSMLSTSPPRGSTARRRSRAQSPPSPSTSTDSGIDMSMDDDSSDYSELGNIEKERRRGLEIASTLTPPAQRALENEFTADCEALGRHRDGTGLMGVVSTLAQLANLKREQIL